MKRRMSDHLLAIVARWHGINTTLAETPIEIALIDWTMAYAHTDDQIATMERLAIDVPQASPANRRPGETKPGANLEGGGW